MYLFLSDIMNLFINENIEKNCFKQYILDVYKIIQTICLISFRMNEKLLPLFVGKKSIMYKFRYKYHFIVLTFIIATVLLFLMNIGVEISFQSHEVKLSWSRLDDYKFVDMSEENYLIKTEGCTIPAFNPFDASVLKFYKIVNPIGCHNDSNPPLVESNLTSLWIEDRYFAQYGVSDESNLSCCYRPFYRQDSNISSSDDRYEYAKGCVVFQKSVDVYDEFVRVECSYKGSEIYKDFHSFVTAKMKSEKSSGLYDFNVLMLGVDAVSRLNFYRTMPLTLKVLKDIGAVEFRGYNKVGDNTFPNLVPILSGLSESELNTLCVPRKNSSFDDCPLIWKRFKDIGYTTAFAEDASSIALFNYLKKGFVESPTDYYWRTFNARAEAEIGHEKHLNAKLCLGPRMTVDVLLGYISKFVQMLKDNLHFGFFWETSLTHDYLNYPILGDAKYSSLITKMKDDGYLNKTVFIILSDHGIRWGQIRTTHQGRMEERLPFLYIVMPEVFKERFSSAFTNLKRNTRRLTTPFDLHETLLDLLDLSQIENEEIKLRIQNKTNENSRGVSLFMPIDDNRTCQSAAIDAHWCTCHQTRKLEIDDEKVNFVANFVVDYMNILLSEFVQCAKLNLSKIMEARIGEPSNSLDMGDVEHIVHDYTVVIDTEPGHGLFEATVRHTSDGWNITGTISRINLYGKQSYCVDNYHLKLYCYCDSSISKLNIFR